jgi:hypothetical protein
VFQGATKVVEQIVDEAARSSEQGQLTLIRFSQAASLTVGTEPELSGRPIHPALSESLGEVLHNISESAAGPLEAVQAAIRLPQSTADETRIVYLLSDFRRPQWTEGTQLRQQISQLRSQVSQLRLVQCAEQIRPNLAITELAPVAGIRAAGVETWFRLTVRNYGTQRNTREAIAPFNQGGPEQGRGKGRAPGISNGADGVTVTLKQDGHILPAITIHDIPAGGEVTRQFRVTFTGAGAHKLEAILPGDAIAPDNKRYFACQLPEAYPVLIIDGSSAGDDGFYLQTALSPGGMQAGGWSPEMRPPSYLRRHEELSRFAAICLLDMDRLEEGEISALEQYVRQGGGVALHLGPQVNKRFYNEHLYRDGTGLSPVALDVPTQLLSDGEEATTDIRVTDHPLFRVFAGQRNSFLAIATVDYYYAVAPQWQPPADGGTRILARLSNGAPWVVEKQLGAGRVVVQLSKLSPQTSPQGRWSNWSLNPAFPVFANELMGHLSAAGRHGTVRTVGDGLGLSLESADYQSEIRLHPPNFNRVLNSTNSEASQNGSSAGMTLYLSPMKQEPHAASSTQGAPSTGDLTTGDLAMDDTNLSPQIASVTDESVRLILNTDFPILSGIWGVDLLHRDGTPEKRLIAMNVPTGEGDLRAMNRQEIAKYLKGIDYHFSLASEISASNNQLAGYRLSDALLVALIVLLITEQLLSYWASYHHRSDHRPIHTSA